MKLSPFRLLAALGAASVLGLSSSAQDAGNSTRKVTVTDASFDCIRDLKPVRGYYVGNLLGDVDATVKAAEASSSSYPVGSVVQLVPTEAMVKREAGYSPETNDWEFFELTVTGKTTTIHVHGSTEVVNRFGGNCLSCHAPAKKFDMICEQTHGCSPIPITPVMAKAIQNTDSRCEPVALPPEQVEALKQLQAMLGAAAPKQ
ncbi:MAG: hypothetical protein GC155_00405 [Alphaproteobacteria bacterium]|nr:hypothetical protein [Alphaproteobacteria bacterium]